MGLDMYLTAKRYIWSHRDDPKDVELREALEKLPHLGHKGKRIKGIEVEAMYWRKANAIHRWFVTHVQEGNDNCGEYYVEREQLIDLREACLKAMYDPDQADKYLPPTGGFFFGSTDIDEWYFHGLDDTVKGINSCLDMDDEWNFYYCSSW